METFSVMETQIADQGHLCNKARRDALEKDVAKTYLSLSL